MSQFLQDQTLGIGFAGACMQIMLACCFLVAWRLRRDWGLQWLALSYALSALLALMACARAEGPAWELLLGLLMSAALGCMVAGLRRYTGVARLSCVQEALCVALLWLGMMSVARHFGFADRAGPAASTVIFVHLAWQCAHGLKPVAGKAHVLAATVLLLNPLWVVGLGIGWLQLDDRRLLSWSALPLAVLGLGLLMASAGRLRQDLQVELEARQRAQAELEQLNESLEHRVQSRTEELRVLVDDLESFSRMVSHDLRGPLGGLSGAARLAQDALQNQCPERALQILEMMGRQSLRLGELVDQLLQLARVSHADPSLQPTPLEAVLAQSLETLALIQGPAARINCVRSDPLPAARIDPGLMHQVFVNLLGNALKFTRERSSPEVHVLADEQPGRLVIEVRDNGPGFDPAGASRLFLPFQRLHGQGFEGSGIGLTIVRRVIERHGGEVWAASRPGEGASFFFSLPR